MKADKNTPLSFNADALKHFYLKDVRENEPAMEFRAAILEYPDFNIELDLNAILPENDGSSNKRSLKITYCVRYKTANGEMDDDLDCELERKPNVDWNAKDWECQLMLDMYQVLKEYASRYGYDLRSPENAWNAVHRHHNDNERFVQIGAWKLGVDDEHYCDVAYIDTLNGCVTYVDPFAKVDRKAQKMISDTSKYYQKKHPYSVEDLERLIENIVLLSGDSYDNRYDALSGFGFSAEQMKFFCF